VRRILLIVDDMPAICQTLCRYMRPAFDEVMVACTPGQAEDLLDDPKAPPTHLLIDQFLGADGTLGADLVEVWRRRYPHLRVAVVLTGDDSITVCSGCGVDLIVRKPPDIRALREYLEQIPA